jgi:hypothetical protein
LCAALRQIEYQILNVASLRQFRWRRLAVDGHAIAAPGISPFICTVPRTICSHALLPLDRAGPTTHSGSGRRTL